jgi:hypothetical protein
MRWVGHVERMGEKMNTMGLWWENQEKRHHYEHLEVDGRILLKWIGSMDWIHVVLDRDQ